MGYLQSTRDEYDNDGNYIGDSAEGNAFHDAPPTEGDRHLVCARCNSTIDINIIEQ